MTPLEIKAIETAQAFVMPWGKYRGMPMDKIRSSYLRWLAECSEYSLISHHADALWNWREEMDCHV